MKKKFCIRLYTPRAPFTTRKTYWEYRKCTGEIFANILLPNNYVLMFGIFTIERDFKLDFFLVVGDDNDYGL